MGDLKVVESRTKVVVYDDTGSYGFATWASAETFVTARARAESAEQMFAPPTDLCTTCRDKGCGEAGGDGIASPRVLMCNGDCGDGCTRARPVDVRWLVYR